MRISDDFIKGAIFAERISTSVVMGLMRKSKLRDRLLNEMCKCLDEELEAAKKVKRKDLN